MSFRDRREHARQQRRQATIALGIRRQARRARGEQRRVLQQLLSDEEALEAAVLAIAEQAPDDGDDEQDGPILRLLNWFLENFDQIFALIVKIVGMFGGVLAMPEEEAVP